MPNFIVVQVYMPDNGILYYTQPTNTIYIDYNDYTEDEIKELNRRLRDNARTD
jgi:hypothetical protein